MNDIDNRGDQTLSRALRIIRDEYGSDELSVDSLSCSCGVSRRVLERVFRDRLDKSPLEIITLRRIRIARELLLCSDEPIAEIAAKVGFADVKSLRHHFQRQEGLTPGAWRKSRKSQTSLGRTVTTP
ncbi:MAG: helix-turn-helix domain-containing protein [Verrucomicrobiota bacterium]